MIFPKLVCALALSNAIVYASPAQNFNNGNKGNAGNDGAQGASASTGNNAANNGNSGATSASAGEGSTGTSLLANAIQSGSFNNGRDELGANEANQALSATSQNNFINNCAGKTLTNGLQITTGSCNGISKSIFVP